jgi:hypothetical protein
MPKVEGRGAVVIQRIINTAGQPRKVAMLVPKPSDIQKSVAKPQQKASAGR